MANIIIASPNRVDATYYTVAFSGGSWETTLPLTNLRDPLLSATARSTDATLASTQFVVDLGAPRDIRVVGIPSGNWTRTAKVRVTAATDAGFTDIVAVVDWRDVWRVVYPWGTLPWGHPSFSDGKLSAEEAQDYTMPFVYVFSGAQIARYWKIEIDDTTNPDGYVEISRLFLAPGYQPTHNAEYGATITQETETAVQKSLGGARFYDERGVERTVRLTLNALPLNELYSRLFDINRAQNICRQVFFVMDADDDQNLHRTSFICTFQELSPIELAYFERGVAAVDIVESIE